MSKLAVVDCLIFDLAALRTGPGRDHDRAPDKLNGLSFSASLVDGPSPELAAARAAGGDAVIGVAVGEDELGRPLVVPLEEG